MHLLYLYLYNNIVIHIYIYIILLLLLIIIIIIIIYAHTSRVLGNETANLIPHLTKIPEGKTGHIPRQAP